MPKPAGQPPSAAVACRRRELCAAALLGAALPARGDAADAAHLARAFEMRARAIAAGDQAYGAVLVRGGRVVGDGISAVVTKRDAQAHAEREALRDARRRDPAADLTGATLYSSSRPCPACEAAAAEAGVVRMVHGREAHDAGAPQHEPSGRRSEHCSDAALPHLVAAAELEDPAELARRLADGSAVNVRDACGRTAALAATHARRPENLRRLIAAGADLDLRDHRSDNPLLYAGASGQLEIVRLALAAGASTRLTNRYGGTALIPAAERGHVEVVRELLERSDIAVGHVNRLGWTALLEAIVLSDGGPRHQQIVALLLAHGADPNQPDGAGVTPLAHARLRGQQAVERLLREAGGR